MNFEAVNPRSAAAGHHGAMLFALLFGFGALVRYDAFFSPQVFMNLLIDNAFLLVVAIGMTFVILSGGIDLSVGSVVALTTMVLGDAGAAASAGTFWQIFRWCWLAARCSALFMGFVIQIFKMQPFIVTLAACSSRAACAT
jgi:ribose/xylose/arabinose/galactoside ABC-type transport system permease subunit